MLYRHAGQLAFVFSQSYKHFSWNWCPHATSYTLFPAYTSHRHIGHSSACFSIFLLSMEKWPSIPRVTYTPFMLGQFLLSAWITCRPEAVAPICPCASIISSPILLNNSILKLLSPRMSGLLGSVLTSRYERLMRSSYSTCFSIGSLLGYPANFMRSSMATCASITAQLIST